MITQRTRIRRKWIVIICIVIAFAFFYSQKYNKYQSEVLIHYTKPDAVWNMVADFSKMAKLNPTIIEFHITADRAQGTDWFYSVRYKEKLSHWPYWINVANADISVHKLPENEGGYHVIDSRHSTCFFQGFYCLNSIGEFRFIPKGTDTLCVETIEYQCPPFLGSFCQREVVYQRRAIMKNLTVYFGHKKV